MFAAEVLARKTKILQTSLFRLGVGYIRYRLDERNNGPTSHVVQSDSEVQSMYSTAGSWPCYARSRAVYDRFPRFREAQEALPSTGFCLCLFSRGETGMGAAIRLCATERAALRGHRLVGGALHGTVCGPSMHGVPTAIVGRAPAVQGLPSNTGVGSAPGQQGAIVTEADHSPVRADICPAPR